MGRNLPKIKKPAAQTAANQGTSTDGFNPAAVTVSYITSFQPGDVKPTTMTEAELNKQLIQMSPQERLGYANKLKAAGYSVGPLTGAVTKDLRRAWLNAHSDLSTEIQAGQALDINSYLAANKGLGGSGRAGVSTAISQISDTAAAALIKSIYRDLAGQDPTPAEIARRTKELRAAQAANPVKTVYDGTGKSTTTGGINAEEFVSSKLQGTAPVQQQRQRDAMTLMMKELGGLR